MKVGLCEKHKQLHATTLLNVLTGDQPIYETSFTKSFIDIVNDLICMHFNLNFDDLYSRSRIPPIPEAKHWAFMIIDYYKPGLSPSQIANLYNVKQSYVKQMIIKYRILIGNGRYKPVFKYFIETIDNKLKINK